jgi:hypothetical protein
MALEISRDDAAGREQANMADKSGTVAGERIYETVDGKLVREGDARAAFLVYGPGDKVKPMHAVEFAELTGRDATGAALAYSDDAKFEEMSRKQARPDPRETRPGPVLVGEKLATELADHARRAANAPVEVRAEVLAEASTDDDAVFTTFAVYRKEDGSLSTSAEEGSTLAYAAGDRIGSEDVDQFNDLSAPDENSGGAKAGDKPADKSGATPANKAVATTRARR